MTHPVEDVPSDLLFVSESKHVLLFHFHLGLSAFIPLSVHSFTWSCRNFELPVFEHDHLHDMSLSFDGIQSFNSL